MYNMYIKMLFCIVSSIISSEFYIALSGRRTPRLLLYFLVWGSHLVIFLPFYSNYEALLDMAQIILELVVIIAVIDSKITDKLLMYVEINVAWGIATLFLLHFKNHKGMFLLCTSGIAAIICFLIIKLHKKDKIKNYGINQKVITFCLCAAMLCCLYSAGVLITEFNGKWLLFVYICMTFVIAMIYQLLLINANVKRNESRIKKYFIMKKLNNKFEEMHNDILIYMNDEMNSLECAEEKLEKVYKSLYNIFALREKIIEDKRIIANEIGCQLSVEIQKGSSSYWGGIKPENASAIINNLLDNALEAVAKNQPDNRYIKVTFIDQGLIVENPYEDELKWDGDKLLTSKNDQGHGLGLEHVKMLARFGRGEVNISAENGVFCVEVRI